MIFKILNMYILYINIQTNMQMDKEKHALFIMLYYVVIMTDYYIFFRQ